MLQVGSMFGAAINGPIADRFGRKITFTIRGVIACVGKILTFWSGSAFCTDADIFS